MIPTDVKRAVVCGLAILGSARVLELVGTTVEDKRKRLTLELVTAFSLLFLFRSLY